MEPKSVLVVEDDRDTQFIYKRFLDHHGFRVIQAVTGLEGLRLARQERPDVIVLDISIPELNGWEVSKRLKADESTAGIPVVIVTAHASPGDRQRARRLGCAGFLTKPCDPARILEFVRRSTQEGAQEGPDEASDGGGGPRLES